MRPITSQAWVEIESTPTVDTSEVITAPNMNLSKVGQCSTGKSLREVTRVGLGSEFSTKRLHTS